MDRPWLVAHSWGGPALAAERVRIDDLVVATSIPEGQRDATVEAARAFYEFWNTSDEADLLDGARLAGESAKYEVPHQR
jgi:hypothetical protein